MIETKLLLCLVAPAGPLSRSDEQSLDGLPGGKGSVSFFSQARRKRYIILDPRINYRPKNTENTKEVENARLSIQVDVLSSAVHLLWVLPAL